MMFTKRKNLALTSVLIATLMIFIGCFVLFSQKGAVGDKEITVSVIAGDIQRDIVINTERAYLGEALVDEKLIEGEVGTYGLYITIVDGIVADSSLQQWWSISQEGVELMTGVDMTPMEDGDKFELTLKTGY